MYNISLIEQYINISCIDSFDGKTISEIYEELIDIQHDRLRDGYIDSINYDQAMDAAQQIFEYLTEDEQAMIL